MVPQEEFLEAQLQKELAELRATEAEGKLADLEQSVNCVVCLNQRKSILLLPCLHVPYCGDCRPPTMESCPICRSIPAGHLGVFF